MRNKYVFVIVLLICISLLCAGFTKLYLVNSEVEANENDAVIVTSFYPMYIATLNIVDGVEGIKLENLSEPQTGCLHDFTLTPEDMKLLSKADMFVINGGGIEGFMADVAGAYPGLSIIEACEGLELLEEDEHGEDEEDEHHGDEGDGEKSAGHHHEDGNAHAWMSVELYRQQVEQIAKQLADADHAHADAYLANAKAYDEKLIALQDRQKLALETMKNQGDNIVIFHEAFAYVAKDYGMNVCGTMDLDEERQISAGEVADVINIINDNNVKIILAEALYGSDMGDTVEKETDVKVIYIDPLNRGEYDKDSYIKGMERNIDLIMERE